MNVSISHTWDVIYGRFRMEKYIESLGPTHVTRLNCVIVQSTLITNMACCGQLFA